MWSDCHILRRVSASAAAPATQPVETFEIPAGVFVVTDGVGRQWTNIDGAAALVNKSRRTMHEWVRNHWVTVRRTPAGRAEILVATLWRDPVEADDLTTTTEETTP